MFLILEYTILEKDMQEKVFKIITKSVPFLVIGLKMDSIVALASLLNIY